jgi:hypothetical protein
VILSVLRDVNDDENETSDGEEDGKKQQNNKL